MKNNIEKEIVIALYGLSGGAGQVNTSLAKYFKLNKCNVEVVCANYEKKLYEMLISCGVKIRTIECGGVFSFAVKLGVVRFSKASVIMINGPILFSLFYYVSTFSSSNKYKNILRIPTAISPSTLEKSGFRRFLYLNLSRTALKKSDHIIANSFGTLEDAGNICSSIYGKSHVIYNPISVDADKFINKTKVFLCDAKVKLLSVGRLVSQKDHKTLIQAFSILKKKYYNSRLDIVGDGELREDLENLAISLCLTDSIFFHGYQSDVETYYRDADLFVLSSRYEGFGLVLIEAIKHGCQIVSTNCQEGPAEILEYGKYGYLTAVGDFKMLAESMDLALRSPKIYKQEEALRRFDIEKIGDMYLEALTGD